MKEINGKFERVLHYIVKSEDLMQDFIDLTPANVIGVYLDGRNEENYELLEGMS